MKFVSILDLEESPYKERDLPAFYQDLNLDQIIERIRLDWGGEVAKLYGYFPANAACEAYRREVFADIKGEALYESLCLFAERMKERREVFSKKEAVEMELQRAVWHIREADCYCGAFSQLFGSMEELPLRSRGMLAFRDYLRQYLSTESFVKMRETAGRLLEEMSSFRITLVWENDRITVSSGEAEGCYDKFLQKTFPDSDRQMKSPFEASGDLSDWEREVLKAFQKRNKEFFEEAVKFYKQYKCYTDDALIRFASEIGFYLSFFFFERRMKERGFAFAQPEPADRTAGEAMSATGLYDLALACAGHRVVTNDTAFDAKEKFFVLTGPNQGGKTTFARSLGQMVYFAKMGLDVPAVSAKVYYFTDLLTHFSVEESVQTGRGKLEEELGRLASMMFPAEGEQERAFVVINELFTTAANYDACIMGKRVLEHFLERDCGGIYVTHLKELSEAHPQIVSLLAMTDEEGIPTFRIVRGQAQESAGAVRLAEKHGLTYGQLKERLS